ncbi:MAG: hypothetical protein A2527_08255 [Candidatus Lambdaproteobacteria bacterium RIFOXYD2_FULL_50_16]|uniref:Putative regulatory protein FmdB zinc ribbon domain-containing protein n=1 Tax=Candidatus Lambdaproteobacteria bacterium RIFOXYD2_FULL_50_16 TaxID=1817772 RepID=A0A1F6GAM7_9PROT|nr:MAG: hypothetical protein A2527_08255 [Candidatus Lambdaproteobacteria bacterium RIFOXYD2_FULL_50_16]
MPLFDYHCDQCGQTFTELRKGEQKDQPIDCPSCGSTQTQRLVTSFALGGQGGSTSKTASPGCGSGGFS